MSEHTPQPEADQTTMQPIVEPNAEAGPDQELTQLIAEHSDSLQSLTAALDEWGDRPVKNLTGAEAADTIRSIQSSWQSLSQHWDYSKEEDEHKMSKLLGGFGITREYNLRSTVIELLKKEFPKASV